MFDVVGIMWLDVVKCDWSDVMLQVCDLFCDQMFVLYEGSEIIGVLLFEVVKVWGMVMVLVVVGGGDNVVGVVGVGMVDVNQVMLLLGMLGVYFVVSEGFLSKLESVVYSFCYALS